MRRSRKPSCRSGRRAARSILPLGGQRRGGRGDPAHDLVQHDTDIGLANPQMLGPVHRDQLGLRHPGEPSTGIVGAQVVIEFRDQDQQRLPRRGPRSRSASLARCSAGDSRIAPSTEGSAPHIRASSVPNDQPTSQAWAGRPPGTRRWPRPHRAARLAVAELAVAAAVLGRGAPGVETQHGQVSQRRQPVGRLAQQVAVHHAAVGGQRVQADQRRHRVPAGGPGDFTDQFETVRGVQFTIQCSRRAGSTVAALISLIVVLVPYLPTRRPGRRCIRRSQHGRCQCRRSLGPGLRLGQATRCAVPARDLLITSRATIP